MKIAIVYDWIDKWGGVERLLLILHEIFPNAPFYTSYVDYGLAEWAKDLKVYSSFMQRLPKFIKTNRVLSLPLYPYAFESFDLSQYDIVISVTSSFAKGVITRASAKHICILLTPTRYLWVYPEKYKKENIAMPLISCLTEKLRKWDFIASQRPDRYLSISQTVSNRCQKYYKRQSQVVYPPFDAEYWSKVHGKVPDFADQEYYLIVSRLELYKKVDLVIDVFNKSGKKLVIVGRGTEEKKLHSKAQKNIKFLEFISDQELAGLYSKAKALIIPQEEDFGYVSLEAQFFGCPVIAYRKGGAVETIIDGKTGLFFEMQNQSSLEEVIERYEKISYNVRLTTMDHRKELISQFSKENFIKSMEQIIYN